MSKLGLDGALLREFTRFACERRRVYRVLPLVLVLAVPALMIVAG